MTQPACRFCAAPLEIVFADLGSSPLANSLLAAEHLSKAEPFYPLKAFVCERCFLVQLEAFESPEHIFGHYLYFSSYSEYWLQHCERYAAYATERFALNAEREVIEVASNDGYLLQYFKARGVRVLGIEPARNVAEVALQKDIPTEVVFFGAETARRLREQGHRPALMVANNVLAHVPDINDFVAGFAVLLQPEGVVSIEFPSLANLIAETQFDTIYHEHFSYLSLSFMQRLFERHGLRIMDVEELPTHGGSLRVYGCPVAAAHPTSPAVERLLRTEAQAGLARADTYRGFSRQVVECKCALLEFLIQAYRDGRKVVGYGAPAKGNTLLNYCGVGPELLAFTVDRSPYKQGLWLPGTRIPIHAPEAVFEARPDYLLILPWNLREEIIAQMAAIRAWGGQFVTPIPAPKVF
jgi:SAM-dependent methyltransferase